jgi:hypothetical protein
MRKERLIGVVGALALTIPATVVGARQAQASDDASNCLYTSSTGKCYCSWIQACTLNVECDGSSGDECEKPIE